MKYRSLFVLVITLTFFLSTPALADSCVQSVIDDGARPYQLYVFLSNSSGTNNETQIYANGGFTTNFTNVRFKLNDSTPLPYFVWDNSTGETWVNITSNGTVSACYGNMSNTTSLSNGTAVFPVFDDFSNNYLGTYWLQDTGSFAVSGGELSHTGGAARNNIYHQLTWASTKNWKIRARIKNTDYTSDGFIGTNDNAAAMYGAGNGASIRDAARSPGGLWSSEKYVGGVTTTIGSGGTGNNNYNIFEMTKLGDTFKSYLNGTLADTDTVTAYTNTYFQIEASSNVYYDWVVMQDYASPEPAWESWSDITLVNPADDSTVAGVYPPIATEINFTWTSSVSGPYNIQVARDSNFNLLSIDAYSSNLYSTQSLAAGYEWFWRVRTYDTVNATPGGWSETSNFTISATGNGTGTTGVQGIVYENRDGVQTPISGALVTIWNSSWSDTILTGTNGYYLFESLANSSVYNIKASKIDEFEDSNTEYVNTTPGSWITKNLLLQRCVSGFNCFYNKVYQPIIVRNLNGSFYSDVLVTAYKGSDVTASDAGYTDTSGTIVFLLLREYKYRITLVKAADNISEEIYIYPSSSPVVVTIGTNVTFTPSQTPHTNLTNYTVNYTTNATWSLQNLTNTSLQSEIGLGPLGQGIVTGIVIWVVVGAGGTVTAIASGVIMAWLGVLTWTTVLFFGLYVVGLYILGGRIG